MLQNTNTCVDMCALAILWCGCGCIERNFTSIFSSFMSHDHNWSEHEFATLLAATAFLDVKINWFRLHLNLFCAFTSRTYICTHIWLFRYSLYRYAHFIYYTLLQQLWPFLIYEIYFGTVSDRSPLMLRNEKKKKQKKRLISGYSVFNIVRRIFHFFFSPGRVFRPDLSFPLMI